MTEIKYLCDICGQEIPSPIILSFSINPKVEIKEEGEKCTIIYTPKSEYDLCEKCYKNVVIFLRSRSK